MDRNSSVNQLTVKIVGNVLRILTTLHWFRKRSQQKVAPLPSNESERLRVLRSLDILDSNSEEEFDEITTQAAFVCDTPIALITLIDSEKLWFKSVVGLGICEAERDTAFCSHAILTPFEPLIIPDAKADARFRDNPLVTQSPFVRFYAGFPLITSEAIPLGTLCVIDVEPRQLSPDQVTSLQFLARQVSFRIEMRKRLQELEKRLQAAAGVNWVKYTDQNPPRGVWLWVFDGSSIYSMRGASPIIKATHWTLNPPPLPPSKSGIPD